MRDNAPKWWALEKVEQAWTSTSVSNHKPITSSRLLAYIARKGYVNYQVAGHPLTPSIIINELVKKEEDNLLGSHLSISYAGKNPNTFPGTLRRLVYKGFASSVACNPNMPMKLLLGLSHSNDYIVRKQVALNPKTPAHILERLSKDKYSDIRLAVAAHNKTLVSTIERLCADTNYDVRKAARKHHNCKNVKQEISLFERKLNVIQDGKADCNSCIAACCKVYHLQVYKGEVIQIAKYLGLTMDYMKEHYVCCPNDNTYDIRLRSDGSCMFLVDDKCSINDPSVKPRVCKDYVMNGNSCRKIYISKNNEVMPEFDGYMWEKKI